MSWFIFKILNLAHLCNRPLYPNSPFPFGVFLISLGIQSPCQMMIGVYNHLLRKVFRFHYHSQKVIGSLGYIAHFVALSLFHSNLPFLQSQVSPTRTSNNNALPGSHSCSQWQRSLKVKLLVPVT